ncbi:MAG: amidohydrolase family protein, partial [Actinobacteria bacterium]|nr:amidohydrolase family protein [Actinomycetota bacterium]
MIDLHAHVVLEESLGAAGPLGPELVDGDPDAGRPPCFRVGDYELVGVRYRGSAFMDLDVRLDRMDELGIDRQVLSPNPLTFLVGVGPDLAVAFARTHNDAMSALVARSPERLGGLAQLPVQDVAASVAELRRAVTDLGLLGAYVSTDPGRPLDDPALDPLYAACVELDVPLLLHPAPGGIHGPRRDERLARFDGDLWLGFAHDEAV